MGLVRKVMVSGCGSSLEALASQLMFSFSGSVNGRSDLVS